MVGVYHAAIVGVYHTKIESHNGITRHSTMASHESEDAHEALAVVAPRRQGVAVLVRTHGVARLAWVQVRRVCVTRQRLA
mgnify:CR=1 FL=1